MNNDRTIDTKHIDVLDGIRAISVIIVLIFHFWQQTWIFPIIQTPWLSFLGITQIDFSNYEIKKKKKKYMELLQEQTWKK